MIRKLLFVATILSLSVGAVGCSGEDEVGATESYSTQNYGWNVWQPVNDWTDTAPNGETYEAYYATWLAEAGVSHSGGKTVDYTLADGTVVPAPKLECSDTAIFLRFLFAQQHGLPMIVFGNKEVMGHFGWYKSNGTRVKSYSQHALDAPRGTDAGLAASNGYNPDDLQSFPHEDATIGAYMDAALRNKRFGYFIQDVMRMYFSGNVSEDANTYYIKPEHIRPGDVQMHRNHPWQGIGHTITIRSVKRLDDALLSVELIQSYMPTLPWVADAYTELTTYAPKPENHSGLRRWRRPVLRNGRWHMEKDTDAIASEDEVVDNRERFKELFDVDYESQIQSLLATIDNTRVAQRDNPNSCRRREDRENAFAILYELHRTTRELYQPLGFHTAPTAEEIKPHVDRKYRTIDDFIWSAMTYERSWVCHWNPSDTTINNSMYDATVAYNREVALATGCEGLRVFRSENVTQYDGGDGFDDLATWAREHGYDWDDYYLDPSEGDEGGALRNVVTDQLADEDTIAYFCSIYDDLDYWTPAN